VIAVEEERVVAVPRDVPADTPGETGTAVTWGVEAVGAERSQLTGRGIAVAVLDTGFDIGHRDYAGRDVVVASFVEGEEAQDGHGHGTHCIGSACGPSAPADVPRYGVAPAATIHAGKVLSDRGTGTDAGILAGIEWAVTAGCRVISMSLGARVGPDEEPSRVFEAAARRALRQGAVIAAAAGNDSARQHDRVLTVSHPANTQSILAVGAVDTSDAIADFSNRGAGPGGGQLDFVGPGVDVLSSWIEPAGHRTLSGTSMATPHVSGVLALLAEALADASAAEVVASAFTTARRPALASYDAGAGMVQAP
jgi:subtilisin family serine protease